MRLDILITKNKMVRSRNTASDLIKAGLVKINGKIFTKPSKDIPEADNVEIEILKQPKYVGRGGQKLEKALKDFKINPAGLTVIDVGSSTGGFTDCLLQMGAKKIFAVDVGTDQLDSKLKENSRVVSMEKTDIRDIETLPIKPDIAVIDVSFISLKLILEKVSNLLNNNAKIIALIKPQFETKREEKNTTGVVKNDETRQKVLAEITYHAQQINLKVKKIIDSPILGGSGNKEYLMLLEK